MSPPVVWVNKYLSNTWEILARLRRERRPGEFLLHCSHPRSRYPGQHHADSFEREPGGLSEEKYLAYALDAAQRWRPALFIPGRKVRPIVRARERFAELGVAVLAAGDAATLDLLNSKGCVYEALAGEGFRLPEYAIVNDLAGFDAAWERLAARHERLCYKPTVSVYGIGFHIVTDRPHPKNPVHIRLDDARRKLAEKGTFPDVMLMEYLPGPERSVDCLAQEGKLLRCVVRRKEEGGQMIEDHPAIVEQVRRLTERFGLTNLFNVQFREAGGEPCLLEINARMSGGLPFACESGVTLPLWAIRLALGTATPEEIPQPQTGTWIPQPEPMRSY